MHLLVGNNLKPIFCMTMPDRAMATRGTKNSKKRWCPPVLGCLFILWSLPVTAGLDVSGHMRSYGPSAKLFVSRPKLVWEVWAGAGNRITKYEMSLNGKKVACQYDSETFRLSYQPDAPLAAGTYKVDCEALVDDALPLRQAWEFEVRPDAVASLPSPAPNQLSAFDTVNQLRTQLNLPKLELDPALCAAAQAHAEYMAKSGDVSHYEAGGSSNFVGTSLLDRLAAFGFVGGASESVGFVSRQGFEGTVKDLFDAPYHRLAFLQPGVVPLGTGVAANRVTLDFGLTPLESIVTAPGDGQNRVQSDWDGEESPNPLRMHGGKARTGYPLVIASFGAKSSLLADGAVTLTGPTGPVECYTNTPLNDDHLHSALVAIPVKPLVIGLYHASASVKLANGSTRELHWSFTVSGS